MASRLLARRLACSTIARPCSSLAADTRVTDGAEVGPAVVTSLDMAAGLTEEQQEMQSLATNFAMNEMFPHMSRWDQECTQNIIVHTTAHTGSRVI